MSQALVVLLRSLIIVKAHLSQRGSGAGSVRCLFGFINHDATTHGPYGNYSFLREFGRNFHWV